MNINVSIVFCMKKEFIDIDAEIDQGTSRQVELKLGLQRHCMKIFHLSFLRKWSEIGDKKAPEKQPYIIAIRRRKGQIKAPSKYDYASLVDFSLNVVENLDDHKFCSYKKAISCKKIFLMNVCCECVD